MSERTAGPLRHLGRRGAGLELQIQNLRVYERRGLLEPDRTDGGTRLYSHADVERLDRIRELLADGLNLAGIAKVLELEDEVRSILVDA